MKRWLAGLLAAILAGGATAQERRYSPADLAMIERFEQVNGVVAWPVVKGCSFDPRDFPAGVVGLVLDIGRVRDSQQEARAARTLANRRCHAFHVNLRLMQVPKDLPDGQYVVAVRLPESERRTGIFVLDWVATLAESRNANNLLCAAQWLRRDRLAAAHPPQAEDGQFWQQVLADSVNPRDCGE